MRMVFVANKADELGLVAFDFPLVYLRNDKLNQPIFGCNNLQGDWPCSPPLPPRSALLWASSLTQAHTRQHVNPT
jgi:hypothetical protein